MSGEPPRDDDPVRTLERVDDPPVIARMIIEIRSDGTRTIARGALEETETGQRVALEARGSTPLALAASLTKTLLSGPLLARQAMKALLSLPARRRRDG